MTESAASDLRFTTHIDDPTHLCNYASRSTRTTDLVVTPEQLHRRNLKRRLAERNQPRSSMRFVRPGEIARDLLQVAGHATESLDRVDRIRAIETLLEDEPARFAAFEPLFGTHLEPHAADIEATRSAVGGITRFDAGRVTTLREVLDDLPTASRRDGTDLVDGALAAQTILAETTEMAVSGAELLHSATTLLRREGAAAWARAYPDVERVHLAGVSSIEVPVLALLQAVQGETPADVHLFLRAGTGPAIASRLRGEPRPTEHQRLPDRRTVDATELVAPTRTEEARLALEVVDQLLAEGVSPSDVLVVARDVATYERVLQRASRQNGQTVSVWTQLRLTETLPYALVTSLCGALDASDGRVDAATLLRPLAVEWVAPTATDWMPAVRELDGLQRELGDAPPRSLAEWETAVAAANGSGAADGRLAALVEWLDEHPASPRPADVRTAFLPVLSTYRDLVLPTHLDQDTPALDETTETARALVRVEELVDEVALKYEEWLDRGYTEESWEAVRYLFETVATVTPGRREHANAAVVDVVDATDTWLRDVPYVVAVGLVDGEWPQTPEGLLPVALRDAILAGETPAVRTLAPLERWTEAREVDHFADAVSTATRHLVCTRFQRDTDGTAAARSPFLDWLSPNRPENPGRVPSTGRPLPDSIEASLPSGWQDD
ncbi:hypothetical protein [Haloarchaeobius sp. DFWS5]|uniref:hypothetical protein n=1 Tax=Haloarchaeobius sp. DFWS5 TaxID=3446114 RepID=UPI003EC0FE0E